MGKMLADAVAVMRSSGLALPRGTKVWPRRFRADPNCCRNSKGDQLHSRNAALDTVNAAQS
jgi:hypothetical protein